MPDADGLLKFHEFRTRVDRTEWRVRAALMALNIQPIPGRENPRQTYYRPEWAEQVRGWIDERMGQGQ